MAFLLEKWRSWTTPSPCRELYRQYFQVRREYNQIQSRMIDLRLKPASSNSIDALEAYIQVIQEEMDKFKHQIEKDCPQK